MGYNRVTWLPGRGRAERSAAGSRALVRLREQRAQRARELIAGRALEGTLISLAALLGAHVDDSDGRNVGRLADVVVRWTRSESYPAVSSVVIRAGHEDLIVGARWVTIAPPNTVRLRSSAAHVRASKRRPAEVALAHDVLDRQILDAQGVQIIRPSDVYLASVNGRVELIGIEIGAGALLRRLGPRRFRTRVRLARVIDWATISGFSPPRSNGAGAGGRRSDLAGVAGTGLVLDEPAGEVRRLDASEVQAAIETAQGADAGQSG
jgi:sporulation protein YlmC with PRC-barrel domain